MYQNKILDFAKEQVVTIPLKTIEDKDVKFEKRYGDLSRWFGENDTIEFDDSAEAFLSIKEKDSALDIFKTLKVKISRNGDNVKIEKESFHAVSMLSRCLISFFALD